MYRTTAGGRPGEVDGVPFDGINIGSISRTLVYPFRTTIPCRAQKARSAILAFSAAAMSSTARLSSSLCAGGIRHRGPAPTLFKAYTISLNRLGFEWTNFALRALYCNLKICAMIIPMRKHICYVAVMTIPVENNIHIPAVMSLGI